MNAGVRIPYALPIHPPTVLPGAWFCAFFWADGDLAAYRPDVAGMVDSKFATSCPCVGGHTTVHDMARYFRAVSLTGTCRFSPGRGHEPRRDVVGEARYASIWEEKRRPTLGIGGGAGIGRPQWRVRRLWPRAWSWREAGSMTPEHQDTSDSSDSRAEARHSRRRRCAPTALYLRGVRQRRAHGGRAGRR